MAFLEDPRLRQRWNQITHDAEAATENAAAGIWSFQQHYVNPCLGSVAASIQPCIAVCVGDTDDRLRRRRERERERAEYSFDFYDDWDEEEERAGGILGGWGGEDWDRLLAGTGSQRKHHVAGATTEQPKRKRGMSYGTKGGRRLSRGEDPTIIPSTQPIGFLSKLPFRMGGTLRYKPSAANLQEHPGKPGAAEVEPLLGSDTSSDVGDSVRPRKRSGTAGSGDTSDSYRSRGDLFPSDGEGEEDAVPLDDDVTYDMVRKDDRSSGKTRSSKGKRPDLAGSRTVSRTTLGSNASYDSLRLARVPSGLSSFTPDAEAMPSLDDLQMEEEHLRIMEDEKIAKSKEAAAHLARARGLSLKTDSPQSQPSPGLRVDVTPDEVYEPVNESPSPSKAQEITQSHTETPSKSEEGDDFVPARLPRFG